jgi:lactoylglutathione lyase
MAVRKAKRSARSKSRKPAARRAKPRKPAARRAGRRAAAKPARSAKARKPKSAATPRARAAAPASAPNTIGFVSQHMDYTTHNLEGVKRFYTELCGFSGFRYMSEGPYLAIQTGPSSSLGFMPPRPGPPEQWQPPREPTLYLIVDDVDRAHRELVAKGVSFEREPADMPWGHRVAALRDPEGRSVQLAQVKK